jgi:DNA-binding NtrC family response regulator
MAGRLPPGGPAGTHVLAEAMSGPVTRREVALVVVEGPDAGKRVPVDRPVLRVGKDPSCDLFVPDITVSRFHFAIEKVNEGYLIRDLGSTNGTFVDDMRIKEAYLRPGAHIKAGRVVLLFQPIYVADEIQPSKADRFEGLVGRSAPMRLVFGVLERVAPTDATVLLQGETGTGKGAAARAIHMASLRAGGPFVVVDCGSISRTLIESELFGHEKGAFTGADVSRAGACERANGGTLFLDEVDDLPLELQPKLLRVLEEREVQRLGGSRPTRLDIRVIGATKKDLRQAVMDGTFREDLYFRLSVVRVQLPPIRDRRDDLPVLCDAFISPSEGAGVWGRLAPALREQLEAYHWPGNVRELRNVLERIRFMGVPGELGFDPSAARQPEASPAAPQPSSAESSSIPIDFERPFKEVKDELVDAFEREYLQRLLERGGGNIAAAARSAGLNRKYFYDLLRKHGLHGS